MLLKVRLGDAQKFVRITEPNLTDFLDAGKENVDHGAHSMNIFLSSDSIYANAIFVPVS